MELNDLAVVIPTFNSLPFLKRTLTCLERQHPAPHPFRTVVVDDGSTDGTGEWLAAYTGALDLLAVTLPENRGRAAARNEGAKRSDRPLLLFLDGDMEFPEHFITSHCEAHLSERQVVIGKVVYRRDQSHRAYARYLEKRGAFKMAAGESIPGRYFLSGNSSLPRRLWEETNGFDERITGYGEDIDFGIRLTNAGAEMIYHPELTVTHLHLRNLHDTISTAYSYGHDSLPCLTAKHPQLVSELRLDRGAKGGISGFFFRVMLSAAVFKMISVITRLFSEWRVPTLFYSYLLYRSYVRGYRDAVEG